MSESNRKRAADDDKEEDDKYQGTAEIHETSSSSSPFDFGMWYPRLRKYAVKAEAIELPMDFIDYLCEDGVFIPPSLAPVADDDDGSWGAVSDDDNDEDGWEKDSGGAATTATTATAAAAASRDFFPDLMETISKVIDRLGRGGGGTGNNGGGVFPKLNHIAPTDARWVTCDRSLRCRTVGELLLLLKSSSRIGDLLAGVTTPVALPGLSTLLLDGEKKKQKTKTKVNEKNEDEEEGKSDAEERGPKKAKGGDDNKKEQHQVLAASITEEQEKAAEKEKNKNKIVHTEKTKTRQVKQQNSSKYQLILKRYCNLLPAREMRCFVRDRRLVGACQRSDNFYKHLKHEMPSLKPVIQKFFTETILPVILMRDFVADVYIDKKMRVWVLDIHPFGTSDPLLFSYTKPPLIAARNIDEKKRSNKTDDADDGPASKHQNFEMRIIRSEEESRPSFFTYDRLPQEKVMINLTSTEAIEQMVDAIREGKLGDT